MPRTKLSYAAVDGPDQVDPEVRYRAYASTELLLDLLYSVRSVFQIDLESLLIYLCVSEASMRPLVLDQNVPHDVMSMAAPPEEYRGVISRLLVADRTGLPRETVRRKVKVLLEMGLLTEDAQKRVRSSRNLASPGAQKAANEAHAAIQRYQARLTQLRGGASGT